MCKEAEYAEPVIHRHDNHAMARQALAIEYRFRTGAGEIASAMNPNHHRLSRFSRPLRRPDIQIETVLATVRPEGATLNTCVPEPGRIADSSPRSHRDGLPPTKLAHRRLRKRDAFEHRPSARARLDTADLPAGHRNFGAGFGCVPGNDKPQQRQRTNHSRIGSHSDLSRLEPHWAAQAYGPADPAGPLEYFGYSGYEHIGMLRSPAVTVTDFPGDLPFSTQSIINPRRS